MSSPHRLAAALLCLAPALLPAADTGPDAARPLAPPPAAPKPEVPFGIEAVTGYRSEYVYRGFKLAHHTFDFQLETEISLGDSLFLNAGGWYATETGSGDFSEAAGFADLRREWGAWALGLALSYHNFTDELFDDGFDTGAFVTWAPNDDFSLTTGAWYDHGNDGWYGKLEGGWSRPLDASSFIAVLAGVSWLDDYHRRTGWNDVYARLSWTYAVSERVSLTPFVGTSLALGSGPHDGSDCLYAGLWFEVNF